MDPIEKQFRGEWHFIHGAQKIGNFPHETIPEYAFIGRSNVGKSSLINALTFRKALARTSRTPGRTQQINFFEQPEFLRLVDLPGYGYAKVSKGDRKGFSQLSNAYFKERRTLRMVFVLIDARRGVMEVDHEILALLRDFAVPTTLILTKIDAIKAKESEALLQNTRNTASHYSNIRGILFPCSASKNKGLEELRTYVHQLNSV